MSSASNDPDVRVRRLYPIIHDIEPLLDHESFVLAETECGGDRESVDESRGPVRKAVLAGALRREERVEIADPNTDTDRTRHRWRYRWDPRARQQLQSYLDGLPRLPDCGHRVHVPDRRDDPEGVTSCKFCGTEYDAAVFRAIVEDHL
jgi:hypothetical protein